LKPDLVGCRESIFGTNVAEDEIIDSDREKDNIGIKETGVLVAKNVRESEQVVGSHFAPYELYLNPVHPLISYPILVFFFLISAS